LISGRTIIGGFMKPLERIGNAGLLPIVGTVNTTDTVLTARALLDAGLDVMEIKSCGNASIDALKQIKADLPEMLVGVSGAFLTIEECTEAVEAGAQFIESHGIHPEIVNWCSKNDVTLIPGCITPTEIETALSLGINTIKFAPVDSYGGVNGCSALYNLYKSSGLKLITSGEINNDNLADFAEKPFVLAVSGDWLCKVLGNVDNYTEAITENAKKAIEILLGFEIAHIGINQETKEAASGLALKFNRAFGFPGKEGAASIFASSQIEITKVKYPGQFGHLAVRTNSVPRAIHYLKQRGFEVDLNTAKYKEDRMTAVYLKEEFSGFAVHLLQK
jgi:2-dehydro-3-deoxyphosphogluconate aldolase / (4S)-4-hydroxy-2-oxoglutarate aldolase